MIIHKVSFDQLQDEYTIALPEGAKVVHVGAQEDRITLWYEHNAAPYVPRKFYIHGTGHHIPDDGRQHRGTVMMHPFVWHIYEGA